MRLARGLRRRLIWLALLATVVAALAPTVSRLFPAARGQTWMEVCSLAGLKKVLVTADSGASAQQVEDPVAPGGTHCGYCVMQQHLPVLPTAAALLLPAAAACARVVVGRGGTTVFKRVAARAHRTRAPPLRA